MSCVLFLVLHITVLVMDMIANMNNERAHSQSEANAKPNAKAGATSQSKGDLGHKGDPYSLSAQRKCRFGKSCEWVHPKAGAPAPQANKRLRCRAMI